MCMSSKIGDFFWPTLDPKNEDDDIIRITKDQCHFSNCKQIERAIEYAKDFAKSEDERRKTVEDKAALFIGSFSVATTLLVSVVADLIVDIYLCPVLVALITVHVIVLIIYLCRASLYAVEALSRKKCFKVGIPSVLYHESPSLSDDERLIELFLKTVNYTYLNSKVTNEKVDAMVMAQEFFKRAIRTVFILIAFLFALLIYA